MHSYSIDEGIERTKILLLLVLSVALGWGINWIFGLLHITFPWWAESPSILSVFGILLWLFDNHFWKGKLFRKMKSIYIPNINGNWDATLISSFSTEDAHLASLTIKQSATRISLSLETKNSISISQSAIMRNSGTPTDYELIYTYENTPKATADKSLQTHQGVTRLQIANDNNAMTGEYFSGRGRQNYGRIEIRRK